MNRTPFPFDPEGAGLASALHGPTFWASLFTTKTFGDDYLYARKEIKRIIKQKATRPVVVSVENDESFGKAVALLMASARGRKLLSREVEHNTSVKDFRKFLAQKLFDYSASFGKVEIEKFCEEREPKKWFLVPERFQTWLAESAEDQCDSDSILTDAMAITLLGCAYSILQPEFGKQIYNILNEYRPDTQPHLFSPKMKKKRTRPQKALSKTSGKNVSGDSRIEAKIEKVKDRPHQTEGPKVELNGTLPQKTPIEERTFDQLAYLKSSLESELAEVDHELSRFESLRSEASSVISEILDSELVCTARTSDEFLPDFSGLGIGIACKKYADWISGRQGLRTDLKNLIEFNQLLNKASESIDPSEINFEDFKDTISRELESRKQELEELAETESNVRELLSVFLSEPTDERPKFIDSIVAQDAHVFANYVFGRAIGRSNIDSSFDLGWLRGDFETVGLLIGVIAKNESTNWIELADRGLQNAEGNRESQFSILAWLTHDLLYLLVNENREWLPLVLEFTLEDAINSNRFKQLGALRRFLLLSHSQGECWGIYEQLVGSVETGALFNLDSLLAPSSEHKPQEDVKEQLIDLINKTPPASGGSIFRQLRDKARKDFLLPTLNSIRHDNPSKAISIWNDSGSIEDKTERCTGFLNSRDRKNLESIHSNKTAAYLEDFEEMLFRFRDIFAAERKDLESVSTAIQNFIASPSTSNESRRLKELLVRDRTEKSQKQQQLFGCRLRDGHFVDEAEAFISPTLMNCWSAKSNGRPVSVSMFFADQLSLKLGNVPSEVGVPLIDAYLADELYLEASLAANGDKHLEEIVAGRINSQKETILSAPIIDRAKQVRDKSDEIDFALRILFSSLQENDLCSARDAVDDVKVAVHEYNFLADPVNRRLRSVLVDAGVADPPRSKQKLLEIVGKLQSEAGSRREHISLLREYSTKMPEEVRDRWFTSCEKIDTPSRWPSTEDISLTFATWIDFYASFILARWEERKNNPSGTALFVHELGNWFLLSLIEATSNPSAPDFSAFQEVKNGRDNKFWNDEKILDHIAPIVKESPETWTSISPTYEKENLNGEDEGSKQELADEVEEILEKAESSPSNGMLEKALSNFRRNISAYVAEENSIATDMAKVREFCRNERWADVRKTIAKDEITDNVLDLEFSEQECVYAIALASTLETTDSGFRKIQEQACIAAAALRTNELKWYIEHPKMLQSRFLAFLCAGRTDPVSESRPKACLLTLLQSAVAAPKGDKTRKMIERILRKGRQLSSDGPTNNKLDFAMVDFIWEGLTGQKNSAAPRSDLLEILYQFGNFDLLRRLAKKYAPQVSSMLVQCLELFNQGESNPAAMEEAQQLGFIIFETPRQKIGPWTKLIEKLNKAPKTEGSEVACRIETQAVAKEGGKFRISALLIPSRYNWPETLDLTVTSENSDDLTFVNLLSGTPLTQQRLIDITIPCDVAQPNDDFARIAFVINGSSNTGEPILIRDVWTWNNRPEQLVDSRFSLDELRRYWPGADGKDVKSAENHHGRESARKKIDNAIRADDGYQRSLLIIGQRRIGKTSLLNQVLNSNPPRDGACCAVFANIGSFDRSKASLSVAIYERIVQELEFAPGEKNLPVLQEFQKAAIPLRRQLKDIRPADSLGGALEGIAKALEMATRGRIKRIAFCLDEFHSILDWENEKEWKQLMWDLRPVIQGSTRVSLFMAGSGITRRFVEDYGEALFGSIESVELDTFSLKTEFDPIAKTFLPERIRNHFAPTDEDFLELNTRAYQLTGGHPWYLSMLGSAMANTFGLTRVTPAMLTHVAEELIKGNVVREDKTFQASNFYGHLFKSLSVFEERTTAIAKLVMMEVAIHTRGIEYPWLSEKRIQKSDLLSDLCSPRELRNVLRILLDELILEAKSESRQVSYRLRIPMVNAALKKDADKIDIDAVSKLQMIEQETSKTEEGFAHVDR